MPKPTFVERYNMSGDTIPPTLAPGGGGGTRTYYGTGVSSGDIGPYANGNTRFDGFKEQTTTENWNRAHWQLAQNADHLYESELARIQTLPFAAAGEVEMQIPAPVYLGATGEHSADIPKILSILNEGYATLFVGAVEAYATDFNTAAAAAGVSFYPGGGLPAVTTTAAIVDSVAAFRLVLVGPGIVGSAVGWSLFNYSQWKRGLVSGIAADIHAAFATITVVNVPALDFTMHRDPVALGWASDDEIYVTHYGYGPYVNFNVAITAGIDYNLRYGENTALGKVGETGVLCPLEQIKGITRELNKLIPLTLCNGEWTFAAAGISSSTRWTAVTGVGASMYLKIPLLLPNYSTLKDFTVKIGGTAALDTNGSLTLFKQEFDGTQTVLGVPVAVDSGAGIVDYSLAAPIAELVNLGIYEYYIELSSGYDTGGARTHTLYGAKVKFDYIDIHILPV